MHIQKVNLFFQALRHHQVICIDSRNILPLRTFDSQIQRICQPLISSLNNLNAQIWVFPKDLQCLVCGRIIHYQQLIILISLRFD